MEIIEEKSVQIFCTILTIILLFTFSDRHYLTIIGVGIFVFFSFKFFYELAHTIEIRDLMILIALLQWIVGPALAYSYNPDDMRYYMAVDEATYISFVLPACVCFIFGLHLPVWSKQIDEQSVIEKIRGLLKRYPDIDLILISGGIVFNLLIDFVPASLRFVLVLFATVRFIGLFFLILNVRTNKWYITTFVIGWLFYEAISRAMFHELLLWLIFLIMFIALLRKFNTSKKAFYLFLLITLALLIQTVKHEFRQIIWFGGESEYGQVFTSLIIENLGDPSYITSETNLNAAITRINQGWIIARIMSYTPEVEPFANGETIIAGIEAALLPRIIAPNKAKAGGRENFVRFTGRNLESNTSMGISTLGEAYANFGIGGGIFFMFFFGLFYNYFLSRIYKLAVDIPTIILWLPVLFLQVVKAESDFVVVLNHLVKASIIVGFIYIGFRRILGVNL